MEGFHHQKRWVSSRKQGNILHGWWFQGARGIPLVSIFFWKWPALRCPLSTFSYELTQISFIDDRSTYSIHSIIDEFPIDGTVKSSIVLGKIFFLVAKCLTCSIPYLPVPTNDPNMDPIELWSYDLRLNYGPFFPSKKTHETSRNLWSHISLYPMIMGYIQSSPKKSHDYPQKKPMIIPWSKPMILVFHLCPGSQVNDSFSHDRRDVMELIEAVLSGQVHPRQIPLIRVAWHLGAMAMATQWGLHQEIWWSVAFFVGTSIELV